MQFFAIENDLIRVTKLVSDRLITEMNSMSGYRLIFVLPLENILAALLIVFLSLQLVAFLPTLLAVRTRLAEAFQYECGNARR